MANEELLNLLATENNKFVEGLSADLPYHAMQQIRENVKAIKSELEKRKTTEHNQEN